MARKLSYKYDFEKEQKSLSQAKCPISLTVLDLTIKTGLRVVGKGSWRDR